MNIQLTEAQLKAHLSQSTKDELMDLICELYRDSEVSKKMLNMRFISKEFSSQLLHEYEERIHKVFFPSSSSFQADTGKAQRIVNEFLMICPNKVDQFQLLLLTLSCELEITSFGYTSPVVRDSIEKLIAAMETLMKSIDNKRQICEILPELDRYVDVVKEYYPDLANQLPDLIQTFCPIACCSKTAS